MPRQGGSKESNLPLYNGTPSSSDEESEVERSCCRPWHAGVCACILTVSLVLGALTLYLVPSIQFHQPVWKVQSVVIESVDLPALDLEGLVAADTQHCPPADPCGVAQAKGCSKCPEPHMWNDGCVCKRGVEHKRSGSSAAPGTIVQADTSACPLLDKCGVFTSAPCSKCPDSSWINDGCLCRQPFSADQFFKGLEGFMELLAGNSSTLVKMTVMVVVQVMNPNVLGADLGEGTFHIRYKGTAIGIAKTPPRTIGANSSFLMNISVNVDSVPAGVAMQMTQEMLSAQNQLSMLVDGSLPATAGLLHVTCGVECDLRIDTTQLPSTVFKKEVCKYQYGM